MDSSSIWENKILSREQHVLSYTLQYTYHVSSTVKDDINFTWGPRRAGGAGASLTVEIQI